MVAIYNRKKITNITDKKKVIFNLVATLALVCFCFKQYAPTSDRTVNNEQATTTTALMRGGGGENTPSSTATRRVSATGTANDNIGNNNIVSPPLSDIHPSKISYHHKWKLWTEMNEEEQQKALDEVGVYLNKYGALINREPKNNLKQGNCVFDESIGQSGMIGHVLCGPKPTRSDNKQCNFVSFGINDDPSWDREVANAWGCRGFAADPTVQHPSKIHDNVTFHNFGANVLMDNEERIINKGGTSEWWMVSFPEVRHLLKLDTIDVLKIDCEGCEMALSRDILREDPNFLLHVDQISIETHVTKTWLTSREHVYYFGLMFALLEEAGFQMEWSSIFGCSKRHEIAGCVPELQQYGWPCGYNPWPGHPNVVKGYSCQEFTLKRYPISTTTV